MRPEMPFLAAGAIAFGGGAIRDKGFPKDGLRAIAATIILVLIASATTGTRIAPLVNAIGMLAVMGSVMATITTISKRKK